MEIDTMNSKIHDLFDGNHNWTPTASYKQHWSPGSYSYLKRPRPTYGFMLVISGKIKFKYEQGEIIAKPGDLIFLPKSSHYEACFLGSEQKVENYLVNSIMDIDAFFGEVPIKLCEKAFLSLETPFQNLVAENFADTESRLRSKGLFYLLLDAIRNSTNHEKDGYEILKIAKEMLLAKENIPIHEIAKACGLSESSFRRFFKEQMKISPAKYRVNVKINQARYLLESTGLTVDEVADTLNFYDTAYFCKVFQNKVGMTPKQYVKERLL